MKNKKLLIAILTVAVLIKFGLFTFATLRVPQSKFDGDSENYLNTASMLYSKAAFATQDSNGNLSPHVLRTPGYPVFLAITHNLMKIPLSGVLFLQVLLTILVAGIVYKTSLQIDSRIAFLSAIIILFDLPITVFSLKILTETLFLLLVSIFIYTFIRYLKTGKTGFILLSSWLLAMATYTRPISYFLGGATAIFIVYANVLKNFKRVFTQALIFLVIVYSLIGLWQIRNYRCCGEKFITTIARSNFHYYGLIKEPQSKLDYAYESWRSFLSLMTRPGTLKYFNSKPLAITAKVLAYPWMALWMVGFLVGVYKIRRNVYYQFLLLVILYFVGVSVFNLSSAVSERFRVPIVPCIAIISAYGWSNLLNGAFKKK
ncbi:MAG: glycosyltransferase family 39 protein [Candidatus Omnitrophica bacterium]|nr:glycosyltransferase family 39 protein [Candidatus Omnitrophota bacterium]